MPDLEQVLDAIRINQGIMLSTLNRSSSSKKLQDYEFKVFSQFGEDGIIQHLIDAVEIKEKTFIEFGVEDFSESNCRFLLMKDNWKGFVIDGSNENIARLKNAYYFWMYSLGAVSAFITRENINALLEKSGFGEDLGILSVDLDGNDYHILEQINRFKPRILICEFNALYGPGRKIATVYDPGFNRFKCHYTGKHYGVSLAAVAWLANKRGYSLVGTNKTSHNAFFVRNDLLNDRLEVLSPEQAWVPPNMRGSRDERGQLAIRSYEEILPLIKGLPVLNVETNQIESL
jgi:hypothetical protein